MLIPMIYGVRLYRPNLYNFRIDPDKLSSKPEDFQVRVKILSGQQLSGSRIRPVVNVKIHNAPSQNTRIRKGSSPIWDKVGKLKDTQKRFAC